MVKISLYNKIAGTGDAKSMGLQNVPDGWYDGVEVAVAVEFEGVCNCDRMDELSCLMLEKVLESDASDKGGEAIVIPADGCDGEPKGVLISKELLV